MRSCSFWFGSMIHALTAACEAVSQGMRRAGVAEADEDAADEFLFLLFDFTLPPANASHSNLLSSHPSHEAHVLDAFLRPVALHDPRVEVHLLSELFAEGGLFTSIRFTRAGRVRASAEVLTSPSAKGR